MPTLPQDDAVKLQTVNLAAKLCIANPKQTKLLCQYVLSLAKYDQNYDIRDRARFLRQLVLPGEVFLHKPFYLLVIIYIIEGSSAQMPQSST